MPTEVSGRAPRSWRRTTGIFLSIISLGAVPLIPPLPKAAELSFGARFEGAGLRFVF